MTAEVLSVNISGLCDMIWNGQTIQTGIYKKPAPGPVNVLELSIDGDRQADLVNHGGAQKAVYFYPSEHLPFWESVIDQGPLSPGSLGENFTSKGLLEDQAFVGDCWRIGTAVVQITQPRSPCYKLALKYRMPDLVPRFLEATKPGFYAAVVQEGVVRAGDSMELVSTAKERLSVADIFRLAVGFDPDPELREAIADYAPLPEFWRQKVRAHATPTSSPSAASA